MFYNKLFKTKKVYHGMSCKLSNRIKPDMKRLSNFRCKRCFLQNTMPEIPSLKNTEKTIPK